jgi:hypothetical protein
MANPATTPLPGDLQMDLLRKILNALKTVADNNDPRPGDLETDLLRKILTRMGQNGVGTGPYQPWVQGDGIMETYRKILVKLGGV